MKEANRLMQLSEYYFSKKLEEVRALEHSGKEIINLGIGSPDFSPPEQAISAMMDAMLHNNAHQYQPYKGQLKFRESIRDFYLKNYDVKLDAEREILPLMGSKEGIFHVSMAFLNEGDHVLIPNPGYPTYQAVTNMVGATPILYNLSEEHGWLPNLEELQLLDLSMVKIMWVNYPNMPTGAKANQSFFKELVAFGIKNDILIVNDNPYSFILNDEPLSLLSIPDAKSTVLELNSLSKTFNMSGWRIGMLCGSESHLKTVLKVKTNLDSGMFYPVQMGAIAAMNVHAEWLSKQNERYLARKNIALKIASKLDCTPLPQAVGLFIWAKINENKNSEKFIDELLYKQGIFVAPGTIFGSQGEGYIRISLCAPEELLVKALEKIEKEKLIHTV